MAKATDAAKTHVRSQRGPSKVAGHQRGQDRHSTRSGDPPPRDGGKRPRPFHRLANKAEIVERAVGQRRRWIWRVDLERSHFGHGRILYDVPHDVKYFAS
jgi:hypothetical protein